MIKRAIGASLCFATSASICSEFSSAALSEANGTTHQGSKHNAPLRVLVTGFHDWKDLGEMSPNLWRCRDNPSCRLLIGPAPSSSPPVIRTGPLKSLLCDDPQLSHVEFTFQTLPVIWGTAQSLDLANFDVVCHLGLGVYDCYDKLLVENGAYNGRAGKDAAGHSPGQTIEMGAPQVFSNSTMSRAVKSLDGQVLHGYNIEAISARVRNNYICNETHWRALKALEQSQSSPESCLKAAFFIHIPPPLKTEFKSKKEQELYAQFCDISQTTDYTSLALGVAGVIKQLLKFSAGL